MHARQKRKSEIFLIAVAVALLACAPLAAAPSEATVNVAGRQRMLSQRVVKAYCQIGLGVLPEVSRTQLLEAVALFASQLSVLESAVTDTDTRDALRALARAWRPFKELALGPVDRERARRLHARDGEVLAAAQRLTQRLESLAPNVVGPLVNRAGRQRMLSQRLAKIYMLQAWGIDGPALRHDAAEARAEFGAALVMLRTAPQNTEEIRSQLAAVELQWKWFENALTLEGAHAYTLVVADASESIVDSMDRITRLYEQLAIPPSSGGLVKHPDIPAARIASDNLQLH